MTDFHKDGLPPGWTTARLPDLIGVDGVLADGDWVESKDQDPNGDVRLTQLADVGDGCWKDKSSRFLTSERASQLRCTFLREGDVLVARMPDPLGRACLFPGDPRPSITAVDVCIVRPGARSVDSAWLMHTINAPSYRAAIARLQSGSTRKRISKKNLCTISMPVSPPGEQERIVEAIETQFSRLDVAKETLKRVQANLKRYRASVLQAAVEGRLVPTEAELARHEGRDYEPASILLERILQERRRRWETAELAKMRAKGKEPRGDGWKEKYKEPVGPDTLEQPNLPEGWCWATIDQIGAVSGGVTKNSKRQTYSTHLPYLRVANVYADELRLDEVLNIGLRDEEIGRVLLQKGDLLVVEGNGSIEQIGRVALWDGSIEPCVHQNHLIKVRLPGDLLARWALAWLLSISGRREIIKVASSTAGLYNLSLSKVSSVPIPLCPASEQDRILQATDQLLSIVDESAVEIDSDLRRCDRLRQGVLKWAFEGKLVDQDPDDEPASALLDRIRERHVKLNGRVGQASSVAGASA